MARTVLKFGGTSVADLERIAHVADIVAYRAARGEKMAVIVSAMSGETTLQIIYLISLNMYVLDVYFLS